MALSDFYIDGTGVCLPPLVPLAQVVREGLYPEEDLAETQLESIAVATDSFPAEMAVSAARQALSSSHHEPADIAITLYAYISNQGLNGWHAGSYVHRFAVGNSTPVIEVGQKSNGGLASLDLAMAYLGARDERAALVATGDRFTDIPHGRWTFDDGLIPGDGGTACVVSRERGFAKILSLHTHADTMLEELHRGKSEFIGMLAVASTPSFRQRKREFLAASDLVETVARFSNGSTTAVDEAMRAAGVKKTEIDHWILPNIGLHELQTYYLDPMEIPLEATVWQWGRTVGHLGAGDQIAGIHRLRQEGRLAPGQFCGLLGIGAGFHWTCAVLQIEGE